MSLFSYKQTVIIFLLLVTVGELQHINLLEALVQGSTQFASFQRFPQEQQ